jgi:Outer membrane protein beta-barrel domain
MLQMGFATKLSVAQFGSARVLANRVIGRMLLLLMAAGITPLHGKEVSLLATKQERKYGPYVGVSGGVTQSQSLHAEPGGASFTLSESDGHFWLGIEIGYAWRTKWFVEPALEFEALFIDNELTAHRDNPPSREQLDPPANADPDTIAAATPLRSQLGSFSTDMFSVAFLVNGVLTLDLRKLKPHVGKWVTRLRPYVGGGIGGAQVWFRNTTLQSVDEFVQPGPPDPDPDSPFIEPRNRTVTANTVLSQDQFVFAYQLFAGLELAITEKVMLYLEYRKIAFSKLDDDITDFENELFGGGVRIRY